MLQFVARAIAGRRFASQGFYRYVLVPTPTAQLPRIRFYTSSILPKSTSKSPSSEYVGGATATNRPENIKTSAILEQTPEIRDVGNAVSDEPPITLQAQDTEHLEEQAEEIQESKTPASVSEEEISLGEGQICTATSNDAVTTIATDGVTVPPLMTPEPTVEPLPEAIPPTIVDTPQTLPSTNLIQQTVAPQLPEANAPIVKEPEVALPIKERVRKYMRTMANSLVVISADPTGDNRRGLLASSFNTVTLEHPDGPIVSFNIKLPSTTYDLIAECGIFEVSATWNIPTAIIFANAPARGAEKPVPDKDDEPSASNENQGRLAKYRLFGLKCRWMEDKSIQVGDHMIMVGQVYDVIRPSRRHEEFDILFYRNGQFGTFVPTPAELGKNAKRKIRLLNAAEADESSRVHMPALPTREDLYKDVQNKRSYKNERREVARVRAAMSEPDPEELLEEINEETERRPKKERWSRRKRDQASTENDKGSNRELKVRGFEDNYEDELQDFLDPENDFAEMDYDDFEGNAMQSSFIRESARAKRQKATREAEKYAERKKNQKYPKDQPAPHYAEWKQRIAELDKRENQLRQHERGVRKMKDNAWKMKERAAFQYRSVRATKADEDPKGNIRYVGTGFPEQERKSKPERRSFEGRRSRTRQPVEDGRRGSGRATGFRGRVDGPPRRDYRGGDEDRPPRRDYKDSNEHEGRPNLELHGRPKAPRW